MIQQVDKYVLEAELGKGAMGSVWLSRHPGLNIPVAVKILDPALAAEDPDYEDRFIKEGRLAASINHPNVVRVIDAGNDKGTYYLIMELIDGADAKQLLEQRGALPFEEVLELAICITEALSTAHSIGIIHRDIKPDNILVTSQGHVKLADLGIAKQINDDYGTTVAGTTMGTPYYIAPEQAMDSSTVDGRCDIYALGGTLYHLLTGTVPFTGPSSMAILMAHTNEPLQHPQQRKADIPDNICSVVCKMMEKDPDDRYQNCSELLQDLQAVKNKKNTAASGKKKKQFKAPVRQSIDKESGAVSKANRSKRSTTKKSSALPTVLGTAVIALVIVVAIALKGKKEKTVKASAVELSTIPSKKQEIVSTSTKREIAETEETRTIEEFKKESQREAAKGDIREQIKIGLERDNPGITVNLDRIQESKGQLTLNLNNLKIKNIASLRGLPITELHLSQNQISDYSPLKKLKLKHLELFHSRSRIPLKSINLAPIKHLQIGLSDIDDLSELSKFRGHYLSIKQHLNILSFLKNAPLFRLDMDSVNKPINLAKMPSSIKDLRLYGAKSISTIYGLKHLNLTGFYLIGSPCDDISVLKGMPLKQISLVGTEVSDLSPLADAPIEELSMPYRCKDLTFLRTLSSLKKLVAPRSIWRKGLEYFRDKDVIIEGFDRTTNSWWLQWGIIQETSSEKFWKMFDENNRRRK